MRPIGAPPKWADDPNIRDSHLNAQTEPFKQYEGLQASLFMYYEGPPRLDLDAPTPTGSIHIMTQHTICVYCGSGSGRNPEYVTAARQLGQDLAESDIGLIYGGGSLGLMGEVAKAMLAAGGRVTGVIPDFLVQRERMLTDVNELIVTANMHERKMTMYERADGFVALPGGMGTLEELVEISTWAQLGRHNKPIILANIGSYWDPLLTLIEHMRQEQFIRSGLEVHIEVVSEAEDIVPAFQERLKKQIPASPMRPPHRTL
jgi:uncharacterized protein (TIGR00730 family)